MMDNNLRASLRSAMAYVSEYLTHFVGRSLESDQLKYDLLSKIVNSGNLLDPSHVGRRDPIFQVVLPSRPHEGIEYSSIPNVRHDLESKLSDDTLVQFETVCFCDIPQDDLWIHCSKYSYFGLAFSKPFLISQGASPVMYIPKPGSFEIKLQERHSISGKVQYEESKSGDRKDLVDSIFDIHNSLTYARYLGLEQSYAAADTLADVEKVARTFRTTLFYQTAIETLLFGHLKFFNATLPPDHVDNYYTEREWRVGGKVHFKLKDIERVFVPREFASAVQRDFPALTDRVVMLAPKAFAAGR